MANSITNLIFKQSDDDFKNSINFCKYILDDKNNTNIIIKALVISSTIISISIIISSLPFNIVTHTFNNKINK